MPSDASSYRPEGAISFPMARTRNDRAELASLNIQRHGASPSPSPLSSSKSSRPRQPKAKGAARSSTSKSTTRHSVSVADGNGNGRRRRRGGNGDGYNSQSDAMVSDDGECSDDRRSRRLDPSSPSEGGSNSRNRDQRSDSDADEPSSKLLPPNLLLSPRADVWIYLCASSFVGVASLGRAHARSHEGMQMQLQPSSKMGVNTAIIISLLTINATLSFGVGIAYRLRPSVIGLTRPIRALANFSLELPLASLTLLLWTLVMIFYNTAGDPAFQVMMEMPFSPNDMNANFFYSVWIMGILSMYLVADLITGNRAGALTPSMIYCSPTSQTHKVARCWMLLFFRSVLLMAFSIMERSGPMCQESMLKNSPYCASSSIALTFSTLATMLCVLYAVLSQNNSLAPFTKAMIERGLALAVLTGYAINAGITTSPGGSGANVGNIYVSSWLLLVLALMLNVTYLGEHFRTLLPSSSSHHGSSTSGSLRTMTKREELDYLRKSSLNEEEDDDVHYSEGDDDDEETLPKIMYHGSISSKSVRMLPYTNATIVTERSQHSTSII